MACGAFYAVGGVGRVPWTLLTLRVFSPSRSAGNDLVGERLSAGALGRWGAGVYSLLYFAYLPQGWPAALFIRRARRSRPQEAAALGTIHFQLSIIH